MTTAVTLDALVTEHKLLHPDGPVCLIIQAEMGIAAGLDRFQPAGFPEIGHVIYDAPRADGRPEKVCIVDSSASMANHLEQVCQVGENNPSLRSELTGLPYVKCVTDRAPDKNGQTITPRRDDPRDKQIATSLTEGHRIASDYFLDGLVDLRWAEEKTVKVKKGDKETEKLVPAHWEGEKFREVLRRAFGLEPFKTGEKYFVYPDSWWDIYSTIFQYDPNSLVHGVLFAKEQIKISRLLTAHLEAFGAARVSRSGVKFDRLEKTTSGQPIFAVDEETAKEIKATFLIDLGMLRSYGRDGGEGGGTAVGLNHEQKVLLLALTLWKIRELLRRTFSYRSGCKLKMKSVTIRTDDQKDTDDPIATNLPVVDIATRITNAKFPAGVTLVYYPFTDLFHGDVKAKAGLSNDDADSAEDEEAN